MSENADGVNRGRRHLLHGVAALSTLGLLAGASQTAHAANRVRRKDTNLRLNIGRYAMPAVPWGKGIYVVGGGGPGYLLGSVERILPAEGKVELLPTRLVPRRFHGAARVDEELIIVGGIAGGRDRTSEDTSLVTTGLVECYNPRTGEVRVGETMPTPRWGAAVVAHQGKVYAIGGAHNGQRLATVEVYDVGRDRWQSAPDLPTARECVAAVSRDTIFVPGGYNGEASVTTVEAYSITSQEWRSLSPLPVPTSAHHVAIVGNTLYSFGNYEHLNQVVVSDLGSDRWQTLPNTGYESSRHNAVVALNQAIYIIGGCVASRNSNLDRIQEFRV